MMKGVVGFIFGSEASSRPALLRRRVENGGERVRREASLADFVIDLACAL